MQERCPNCSSVLTIERNICHHCGQELVDFGYALEASTYWENDKRSAICTAIILGGVVGTVLIRHIVPTVAGVLLAGLYYLLKYDE